MSVGFKMKSRLIFSYSSFHLSSENCVWFLQSLFLKFFSIVREWTHSGERLMRSDAKPFSEPNN